MHAECGELICKLSEEILLHVPKTEYVHKLGQQVCNQGLTFSEVD